MRNGLTRQAGGYVQADVDAWLARALAALLAELARLVPGARADELAFAARLATTELGAVGDLAVFLACCPLSVKVEQVSRELADTV